MAQDSLFIHTFATRELGRIGLAVTDQGLLRLEMFLDQEQRFWSVWEKRGGFILHPGGEDAHQIADQIKGYLLRERKDFQVPVDWRGVSDFQRRVLEATRAIPYGETRSYGEIARRIGNPRAARAVGGAESRNPVPLIIPCHRVIGSDGSMRGYGGPEGVGLKAQLLAFETGEKLTQA